MKVDADGNKLWDRRYGGLGNDGLISLAQTPDSGFILGGNSSSNMGGDKTQNGRGGFDFWIVKIDKNGNKEWDRRYGGTLDDWFGIVQVTPDSGYILCGSSNSSISGDKTQDNWDVSHFTGDVWIVKTDLYGNIQWDKRYGGIDEDGIGAIIQTKDGGYLLGCVSSSDSSGDKTQYNRGESDYWLIKIDSIGSKEWDKRYGGTSGDLLSGIARSNKNGYLLSGTSYSDIGGDKTQNNWGNNHDFWVIEIDSIGNKIDENVYGGANGDDYLYYVYKMPDNGYLLSGTSNSSISGDKTENNLGTYQTWIIKTDSSGAKEWDKTIFTTGSDGAGVIAFPDDGCYVIAISTNGGIGGYKTQANWDTTNQTKDYWIVKFCMDTVTGIDDPQLPKGGFNSQIQVWPNPFSSDLSIALKGENIHEATFTITNMFGQTIYYQQETNLADSYTKVLDLSYLPNGIYFITVTQNGEVFTRKVVKE